MAFESVELDSGSGGAEVAVDRVNVDGSDKDFQYIKLVQAADGVTAFLTKKEDDAHASGDEGMPALVVRKDTAASLAGADGDYSMLEVDANGRLHVLDQNSAAILTDTTAIKTALQIMDDWDESDRAKVNLIAGQAGIAAGTGVDGATVPRVTLATDVPLPAGTNAIGKLAANSGVDIGDVDVTSQPARDRSTDDIGVTMQVDKVLNNNTELAVSHATISVDGAGLSALIAAAALTKYIVHALALFSASDTEVDFYLLTEDGAAVLADATRKIRIDRDGSAGPAGFVLNYNPLGWFKTATDNKALQISLSADVDVCGCIVYSSIVSGI